ncbi:hypothetical protein PTTG_26520 [Puccinia triticina 1-1 BBBD Race 1]|uniref:Aldedh domain-containing protein n=1 Tax=Puccinia triticina (isolate 1-1 / race 1 (BBBD)) TaxID=630390 RepID=A0A180GTT8_PUCT1|nr:hypothetical protein PTTG_26520 [Puccinia triticina 1-1 BBBD Race 1]
MPINHPFHPAHHLLFQELERSGPSRALSSYWHSTPAVRQSYLRKFNQLIFSNAEDLGPLIVTESWKSWKDALGEVNYAASLVDWFVEEALRTEGIIVPSSTPAVRNLVIKQPIGVVAALCPWNFPAANITRKVARTACTIRPPAMTPQAARLPRPPPPPLGLRLGDPDRAPQQQQRGKEKPGPSSRTRSVPLLPVVAGSATSPSLDRLWEMYGARTVEMGIHGKECLLRAKECFKWACACLPGNSVFY